MSHLRSNRLIWLPGWQTHKKHTHICSFVGKQLGCISCCSALICSDLCVLCITDASGRISGQHRAGRPGGREGSGPGTEGGEDTWSRLGRSRDGALHVRAHAFKDRKKKKPSPRLTDERFTDREIDGCVWSNKLHTDWETEDLKQLKGETGGNDGRHDELKTPYTLLKGSIRALQVMEFRRWRAHFIPIRGNRIQLKVQVNGWV